MIIFNAERHLSLQAVYFMRWARRRHFYTYATHDRRRDYLMPPSNIARIGRD